MEKYFSIRLRMTHAGGRVLLQMGIGFRFIPNTENIHQLCISEKMGVWWKDGYAQGTCGKLWEVSLRLVLNEWLYLFVVNNIKGYVVFSFFAFVSSVCAEDIATGFENYRVESVFTGANHALVGSGGDEKWVRYRAESVKGRVNFAGHYIVSAGDCGGGAVCGEIIDVLSGKVVSAFPNAYELGDSERGYYDANFKEWSHLLVISGVAADAERGVDGKLLLSRYRTRYYEFRNEKLVLIKVENER